MNVTILYEDNEIIVCEKPFGMPSQNSKSTKMDLVNYLKNHVAANSTHTAAPYIGLIHRLDQPVGGLMVFAKTKDAAAFLSKQLQQKELKKQYIALITSDLSYIPKEQVITLSDYIIKNGRTNYSSIGKAGQKEAKEAILRYQVKEVKKEPVMYNGSSIFLSLVKIDLITGRHHQIRVQMKHHIGALWGDAKYNPVFSSKHSSDVLGLYACSLTFKHPAAKKECHFHKTPTQYPFDLFPSLLV